jgi:hypothetical protein
MAPVALALPGLAIPVKSRNMKDGKFHAKLLLKQFLIAFLIVDKNILNGIPLWAGE